MDETVAEFIKRIILKIPMTEMMTILKTWDFLSEHQLQTINFRQRKEALMHNLVLFCEEKCASLNDAASLDIICKDPDPFDEDHFKRSFMKVLRRALQNVTVSFRDGEENAMWIRIAWGTHNTKPNQYKATYMVYYPQTPYVFISFSRLKRNLPLLSQALAVATKYHQIEKVDLRSRYLDSLKAIVFKQYNQVFETHNSTSPLQERSLWLNTNMDLRIIHENQLEKERVLKVTQETFGDYPQPRLEFAQYQLETKFKSNFGTSILADREEPLRCLIKFSSPHLMEALKSLAPAGIADAPLSPLLTCIPNKGMNYFKIRDK
ncbi:PREDICTED: centromere protein N isoform X2 [Chrysochloris asiatica]|uniref:Centromere protein N isoform X2 n=1 Tax=Chrysochloris asiatica TaxID=185453 RepID=A0A9B0WLR6_CHRAS|nr:PREDICTED: centromere protein N isoform X2 [Chrysochloris asiatica]